MRHLTINELRHYSSTALRVLAAQMQTALSALPQGSPDYDAAFMNLRTIRWVLARRELSPH